MSSSSEGPANLPSHFRGAPIARVTIEYVPNHPEKNRIKGNKIVSILAAVGEYCWRILVRNSTPVNINDHPKALTDATCVLLLKEEHQPGREFQTKLSLAGDSSDSASRPVLFDHGSKAKPMLLSELEVPAILQGSDSVQVVVADQHVRRFGLLGGVVIVVVTVTIGLWLR